MLTELSPIVGCPWRLTEVLQQVKDDVMIVANDERQEVSKAGRD